MTQSKPGVNKKFNGEPQIAVEKGFSPACRVVEENSRSCQSARRILQNRLILHILATVAKRL
jgi:hypothetical protein